MRLLNISILLAALGALIGCTVTEAGGDVLTTDDTINYRVFDRVVTPLNRVMELSDFYYRYRIVRDNDDAVGTLKDSYFGETVSMGPYGADGVEVDYWGHIDLAKTEGSYYAVVSPHWMGLSPSYTVTPSDYRSYDIVYNPSNNDELAGDSGYEVSLEAEVSIDGYDVTVNRMDMVYTETSLSEPLVVKVSAGSGDETVRISLCRGGEFSVFPVDGVFYYSVSGYYTSNFRVRFYGDYFEIIRNEIIEP